MAGHKPFSELTKGFSPQRKANIEVLVNKLREEIRFIRIEEKSHPKRSNLMLLSTLPGISGATYSVRGVVFAQGWIVGSIKREDAFLEKMFNSIVQQASGMGADAIIDIKIIA